MVNYLKLCSYVVTATILVCMSGCNQIAASELEKHLEKVGTRVGKNEYISVFKEPAGEDGKKSKTFVLLSKLYMLGQSSSGGDLNEVINYPGGPLKLRRQYIIPSAVHPPAQQHSEKILFPKEDIITTRKPSQYNVHTKKTISGDGFAEKYAIGGESATEERKIGGFPLPLLRYLSQLEETGDEKLNPVLAEAEGEQGKGKDGETLGYYTLITVPRSKKASDGCPTGHSKDHRGVCREVFTFGGSAPRSS